jgi:hypothetical protein
MAEKTQDSVGQSDLHKEEIGAVSTQQSDDNDITNKLGEVGVLDAPDGGRAAWTVIFGCFCVSFDCLKVKCICIYTNL